MEVSPVFLLVFLTSFQSLLIETGAKTENVVRCEYPYEQVYSRALNKCVSLIGGPCAPHLNDISQNNLESRNASDGAISDKIQLNGLEEMSSFTGCVEGAACSRTDAPGLCVCVKGLLTTPDRKCSLDYGKNCHEEMSLKCDKTKFLGCIEGKCTCVDSLHRYNQLRGACQGLVGAFCATNDRNSMNPGSHWRNVVCGPGSACYPLPNDRFGNGLCQCDAFHEESANRTCMVWRNQETEAKELEKISWYAVFWFLLIVVYILLLACCKRPPSTVVLPKA